MKKIINNQLILAVFFGLIALNSCGKKCVSKLAKSSADNGESYFLFSTTNGPVWATEGSWQASGNNIIVTASGFGTATTTGKVTITYPATTDSTAPNGIKYAKIQVGKLVYLDATNREFVNTEIAVVKYSELNSNNSRKGKIDGVAMYSASAGSFIFDYQWLVCKQ
jgi:hypothetical protein